MNRIFASLFFLFVLILSSNAQKDLFADADYFYATEEYEEALYLFLELAKQLPGNSNIDYMVGMSYLNIPGQEHHAVPYLEKAAENTSLKYKEGFFKNEHAPHHAIFYLGKAYRIDNQLDKALQAYQRFMDIPDFERNYNLRIVEEEIKSCQRAKIIKDSPVHINKMNLGNAINAGPKNFHPVVNPDETVLVYVQEQKFYNAIMYSVRQNGEWSMPVNITPQLGSDGDMIPTGLSPDGKTLLLSRNVSYLNNDIYISELKGMRWNKAKELEDINTNRNEDHAAFGPHAETIIFSSDRRKGFGGLDLYITRKKGNYWSKPENLGSVINTEEDETSGFLMGNEDYLYFSSKGHFNMGGFDLFVAKRENENWTEPSNIGYPVNTTGDNRFLQPVSDGKTAYISFFNLPENLNQQDIYKIEILPFKK